MDQVLYVISTALSFLIDLILLCMLVTIVLNWLMVEEDNPLYLVFGGITEFFVYPLRFLCEQKGWFQSIPIDMPFLITMIAFSILNTLLKI